MEGDILKDLIYGKIEVKKANWGMNVGYHRIYTTDIKDEFVFTSYFQLTDIDMLLIELKRMGYFPTYISESDIEKFRKDYLKNNEAKLGNIEDMIDFEDKIKVIGKEKEKIVFSDIEHLVNNYV